MDMYDVPMMTIPSRYIYIHIYIYTYTYIHTYIHYTLQCYMRYLRHRMGRNKLSSVMRVPIAVMVLIHGFASMQKNA